jgi:hypothetical protein
MQPQLFQIFHGATIQKIKFLHMLLEGVLKHPNTHSAYEVILESFGVPLFRIRNLNHTLQDPVDRMVYVIHLEDTLHTWRVHKEESVCWEAWIAIGIAGIVGITLAFLVNASLPTPNSTLPTLPTIPTLHLLA